VIDERFARADFDRIREDPEERGAGDLGLGHESTVTVGYGGVETPR
jgi:hypothetical protein